MSTSQPARVLIADDEPAIVVSLEFLMRQEGFTVRSVADGVAALEAARAFLPDLILLDVMLPKMNGLAVCRALREDALTAHCAVILLTAKASAAPEQLTADVGADCYIAKPFATRELMAEVRTLLARTR